MPVTETASKQASEVATSLNSPEKAEQAINEKLQQPVSQHLNVYSNPAEPQVTVQVSPRSGLPLENKTASERPAAAAMLPRGSSQVAQSVSTLPAFNTSLKFEDGYQFMPDGDGAGMTRQMTGSKMVMLQQSKAKLWQYPGQVTLNHVARKQEIQRINKSNMVMLKALRQIKPMVPSAKKYNADYKRQLSYRQNLSRYPSVGTANTAAATTTNTNTTSNAIQKGIMTRHSSHRNMGATESAETSDLPAIRLDGQRGRKTPDGYRSALELRSRSKTPGGRILSSSAVK